MVPNLTLRAFQSIKFQDLDGPLQFASMPFGIRKTSSGIVSADFYLSRPPRFISLDEWREQTVTLLPCPLTVKQIIRTVCDKGGGAHVDDHDGEELAAMKRGGPTEGGLHVPFIIATARYALNLGEALLTKHGKRWEIEHWKFYVPPPASS